MNSKLEQPTAGEQHYHEYLPSEDTTPVDGLVVRGLTVETKGHRRLDAVDFSMTPGSMVAVVGTSGAGKSTFVKAIAGLEPPTAGTVVLGGIDVGSSFDLVRGQIAYVPQDNILHESLTVRETLAFAAELRLPGESAQERAARCTSIISDLGLEDRAGARVDALSGGQRKRVNVAVELLTAPALLILDEPTSGLDPASERSMLQLLRRIADSGQMVIVVTHGMGDLDIFDRVFALASGGVPVFDDAPQCLTGFLGATNTTDVFARLSELDNASSLRLPPAPSQPNERAPIVQPPPPAAQRIRTEVGPEARRQLWVLARRYARVLRSDRRGLISLLLQAPILGIVMWAVFEPSLLASDMGFGPSPEAGNVLIALVLASIYLGASNSVREIAKERPLLRREQSFGLSAFAYLTSKFVVLGAITIAQSAVLVIIATARQGGPGDPVLFPDGKLELIVLISLCGLGALSMGLLISALSRSSDRAMVVLPVVLFIQFMLAGVTFSISTPGVQQLSWLVTARWGFSGAASTMDYWTTRGCEAWTDCDDLWQHSASHWLTAVAMVTIVALAMFALAWWSLERSDPARVLSRNLATRSPSLLPVAPSTTYAAPRPPIITETRPTKVRHREPSTAAMSSSLPPPSAHSEPVPQSAAPHVAISHHGQRRRLAIAGTVIGALGTAVLAIALATTVVSTDTDASNGTETPVTTISVDNDSVTPQPVPTTQPIPTTTQPILSSEPAASAGSAIDAEEMDLAALLPPFHEELDRLVAPRPDGPAAIMVASAPRQAEPRTVDVTLIEWDRSDYQVVESETVDCGYLEDLVVDEDQMMLLSCTGGASAHYLTAFFPDLLDLRTLPSAATPDEQSPGAWLHAGWERHEEPGRPDDLTIYARRCDPSCADGKLDTYQLKWTGSQWDLESCTPEDGVTITYPSFNGSVSDLGYSGCPYTDTPVVDDRTLEVEQFIVANGATDDGAPFASADCASGEFNGHEAIVYECTASTQDGDAYDVAVSEQAETGSLGINEATRAGSSAAVPDCPSDTYTSELPLQLCDRGIAVSWLETALTDRGYSVTPDDELFGFDTQSAVLAFQRDNGLDVDGLAGPATWRALGGGAGLPGWDLNDDGMITPDELGE